MSDPKTTPQVVGQVAGEVVAGLGQQPLLLGIVVLNVLGIAAALYFLNLLATNNSKHLDALVEMLSKCHQ